MRVSDLTIKNKSICVEHINISIAPTGITILWGENGCGKTTLIETMLFGKEILDFDSKAEKDMYKESRYALFTYCPQKVIINSFRVKDYLYKMGRGINHQELKAYLERFSLQEDILEQRFSVLSGGEQKKLSIISSLMKHTPYIFMDEPSNNLDNQSTEQLRQLILEEAKNRAVILVTHDQRIGSVPAHKYCFQNDTVVDMGFTGQEVEQKSRENKNSGTCRPGGVRQILALTKNMAFVSSLFMFMVSICALMLLTNFFMNQEIDTDPFPERGIVFCYNPGHHDELNARYERIENIEVDEELFDRYIFEEAMEELSNLKGVKEIYIVDDSYTYKLSCALGRVPDRNPEDYSEYRYISCPSVIYENWENGMAYYLRCVEGKLPEDESHEIAISMQMLIEEYGYTIENVNEAIGDKIYVKGKQELENEEYTIVGFPFENIAVVSFDGTNLGTYTYDEETYGAYCEYMNEFYDTQDWNREYNDISLITDKAREKAVLEYCIENYPGTLYFSHVFMSVLKSEQLKEQLSKWVLINLLLSVIIAGIIYLTSRDSMRHNMRVIWDLGNYYINRKRMIRLYFYSLFVFYWLLLAACQLVNARFSNWPALVGGILFLDGIVIFVPVLWLYLKSKKEVR